MGFWIKVGLISAGLIMGAALSSAQWTEAETGAIQTYWSTPDRTVVKPSSNPAGPWLVRLTPEGSKWLWEYNNARGKGKLAVPPTQLAPADNERELAWEKWVDAKVAFDRWTASLDSQKRNNDLLSLPTPVMPMVDDPGPAPLELVALVGEAPAFASAVRPNSFEITFEDDKIVYEDNVEMRPRYAYYRFTDGVMSAGTRMSKLADGELASVLGLAGISESEAKIFKAVSLLEGGFDSVNTYDTGFVSVGFIQFASLRAGAGSLGRALQLFKQDAPEDFESDFRRFGIDVSETGSLIALDIETGIPKFGADANQQIIKDKRLIAVFQRAGRRNPFRVAQLKTAKEQYFPVTEKVEVTLKSGLKLAGVLGEIVKSEAGLATFMDRKVNTGSIVIVSEALALIAEEKKVKTFAEFAAYEHALINALWYRENYSFEKTLTQPKTNLDVPKVLMSRYGGRFGRKSRQ